MCMKCQGMTDEEVREDFLAKIERFGWTLCSVEGGGGRLSFTYTIGLTRYHGHPELVVSGLDQFDAASVLNDLGARVRGGERFEPGQVVPYEGTSHRSLMVRVTSPEKLAFAQEIYRMPGGRPVPALQVIWSDHAGAWPWQVDARPRRQELLGRPQHLRRG
ncbi:DUF4262 domain-containing protein [Cellulomonas rhizosphaerae]|uniref:DUF4262 domain-containing protein n=2 Tax=Cellulomonas rhizosphaerae TaxID=2293719 RepID=A0A413RIP1_9CELL|nr:DUF4262 domain-containing protein [Cellulomonas rhizosphaerae]